MHTPHKQPWPLPAAALLLAGLLLLLASASTFASATLRATTPAVLLPLLADPAMPTETLSSTVQVSPTLAAPLRPLTVSLRIAGYSGPATLHLYDAQERPAGRAHLQVQDGQTITSTLLARGAPGPQRGVLTVDETDGRELAVYDNLFRLQASTSLQTGLPDLDALYPTVRGFLEQKVVSYELDGTRVRGYRSPDNPLLWLRDHVYQGRGFRYFETDMTSLLAAFRRAQRPDGSFPDVLDYPELLVEAHRLDTESDLEYLFVQGVYEAWQATGDSSILAENLEAMRRGLEYITSDPLRWDAERGLVRRPYTIDTWDFAYGPTTTDPTTGQPAPRHWIDEQTIWGIFHGDNTGLVYALELMTRIERHLGNEQQARQWDELRLAVKERLNALSWNGDFLTHFVPISGTLDVPGVDTDEQLSLSNAYALNRELLSFQQGRAIVDTYFQRRDFDRAFAEWYSIDPPFPPGSFGLAGRPGEKPGEYVNGGIMPLTGGELARGAFRFGAEDYGFDILRRYAELLRLTESSYLWYYPDGSPGISGPHTVATDGWGSSAMLGALMEGAAGIEDRSSGFADLHLSPRWSAAPEITSTHIVARYGPSGAYVAYQWQRSSAGLALDVTGSWQQARIRMLLPREANKKALTVWHDGLLVPTELEQRADSRYVVLNAAGGNAAVHIAWWEPIDADAPLARQLLHALQRVQPFAPAPRRG